MASIKLANGTAVKEIRVWNGMKWEGKRGKVFNGQWLNFIKPNLTFQDDISTVFGATRQSAKTYLISAINAGATTLPVQSTAGFFVGQEITVTDGTNQENLRVTGISGNSIIVTPTKYAYKLNAIVARSTAVFSSEMTYGTRKTYSISIS